MKDNLDFKELWSKQSSDAPKIEELLSNFERLKRKNLIKLICVDLLMIVTIAIIILIGVYFEPKLITTKIGIVVTLLAISGYLVIYNQLIPYLTKMDEVQNNSEFIKSALKLKNKQRFLQTTMLQTYFISLTIGLCLFLYEYVLLMPFPWPIIVYSITISWIAFNWFYLRPVFIKRELKKINVIIDNFEKINQV